MVTILYHKGYFGFKQTAYEYVDVIYNFIDLIHESRRKKTLDQSFGAWYCQYKPKPNTTWFITFHIEDDLYFVQNIFNNHTLEYVKFIPAS